MLESLRFMSSVPPGTRRILIVDDASVVAETLELILLRWGHQPKVAHSAEEAIQILSGWKPDLAILDLVLPGMNGIELSDVLRANYPDCLSVLISGHPQAAELLKRAGSQGKFYSILPKPLDPALILAIAAGAQSPPKYMGDA